MEPEALSPLFFAGMTRPELFFGVSVGFLLWRSLWRWDAGKQCWLWQGLLCKQWLENFLEECQLSLARALLRRIGLQWCCWGHWGCST